MLEIAKQPLVNFWYQPKPAVCGYRPDNSFWPVVLFHSCPRKQSLSGTDGHALGSHDDRVLSVKSGHTISESAP